MFWAKRLKQQFGDTTSSWALPFGDLMSLLLVVFVMITAMSEIRTGARFNHVGQSVKGAFGFDSADSGQKPPASASTDPRSLFEQLAAGASGSSVLRLAGVDSELLPACEMRVNDDQIHIRIPTEVAFIGPSSILAPDARKLFAVIADYLREGRTHLEVRSYGPGGALPADTPYRDGLDVASERARQVARELALAGVAENRLSASAFAQPADIWGVEIIVHARSVKGLQGNQQMDRR